ncbi:MAG: DivIVA domain-containing protein [Clostridia bacterium]|nr:DivIVA domain-containing protein [Clostridia bacterium]MBQ6703317.1 DivIVA domain-containing protein [Clostridia bacterium]
MKISDIANKKFSRAFLGYNISEVDAFLDEIAKDLERREQDIKLLELRNEMLIERLAASGVSLASDKAE